MARRPENNIITLPDLQDQMFVFKDRTHAGEILSDMLTGPADTPTIIFGIPAGGAPVGAVIARRLGLPFDLAIVSKITLPWNTESGYGAVAFDHTVRLNDSLLSRLNLSDNEVDLGISRTTQKVDRRTKKLRGGRPFPDLSGHTAVLVDDGLASGFTMFTAIDALKNHGAQSIHVAIPTAHYDAVQAVAQLADKVYCANVRSGYSFAVAEAYKHWYDVPESEVRKIVESFFPKSGQEG